MSDVLSPVARAWLDAHFEAPTPVQREGWPRIAAGEHALLLAPTGSGKTLAAFLAGLDRLARALTDAEEEGAALPPGVRLLYVSPLKALVYDVERNLRAPLRGLARTAEARGERLRLPRVAVRTGDTPPRERRGQGRDPAEVLVTTPESLYLILGSRQRETLASVEAVIVDEIHALAGTKRGAHLALSLERVAAAAARDPQRIGLSATARPASEVARFLGGDRPVSVVDASAPPRIDLRIEVPVPDMTRPESAPLEPPPSVAPAAEGERPGSVLAELAAREAPAPAPGLWPALYPRILEAIRAHRSTLVFVNSRGLCERMSHRLNELAGEELVRAHHGSLAQGSRREVEEALKAGRVRGLVATSSLELGIDMGAVDLVLLVESPGSVSRGLQRVGRAGHRVDAVSRGRLLPKHRGDLLEAAVVARGMREGAVEALAVPRNPLDVLAQQCVAMCGAEAWDVDALHATLRRAAPYRELSREALCGVLDMLAGRYPSTDFADLRPRLVWDREADRVEARPGAARLARVSGGTIPDRGQYAVHLGPDGPRVGELDEEMVHETRAGQTLTLGASTWRVARITRDRVEVHPAPGELGRLPFWRGEGPGRPAELGRALGRFVRELDAADRADAEAALRWLARDYGVGAYAARNLVEHLRGQREATGTLPTDRALTVERFRDELGDWRVCLHSPFGARIHAPWALALETRLGARRAAPLQSLSTDDGVVLRMADADELPGLEELLPEPEEAFDLVVEALGDSALFASRFRENAARALLLPRRRPGRRTPLWAQRLRAQQLLAVAKEHPSFPILLETYRECLQDVFDVPGLAALLAAIRRREVRVEEVETHAASPFARSLVFAYTAQYLYQGDAPAAERRAHALALDRELLRELLGEESLRELLDAEGIESLEAELQGLAEERRARDAEEVHDRLRRVGDLGPAELEARCAAPPDAVRAWVEALERERRVARLRIAGEERLVLAEDAALYRDALGCVPPPGLPEALLGASEAPLAQILARYARTHGPFEAARPAARYGLRPAQVEAVLEGLERQGRLRRGALHPHGAGEEWCEVEVLRRLRRRTLAKLRGEVAPVGAEALARFLPEWQGVRPAEAEGAPEARPSAEAARARLREAVAQLEGLPLSFAELERSILPARVPGFDPRMLDELGALGELVWVGRGALGERDGRVVCLRRPRAALLAPEALREEAEAASEGGGDAPAGGGAGSADAPVHRAILAHLERRGACFFDELLGAARAAGAPGEAGEEEATLEALRDLAFEGRVTNDTFAPLRALAAPRPARGRRRSGALRQAAGGRWSLVRELLAGTRAEPGGADPRPEAQATRRAHARALALLERWGVVAREVCFAEGLPGGMSAVYPVLRELEEQGRIRRGHFVEGLSGAQFAFPGAVERLRAARSASEDAPAFLLAAGDPANPYGALLPWPEPRATEAPRPRRAAGAHVVLVGGALALFAGAGARRITTFPALEEAGVAARAARALGALLADRRRRGLRVEAIDGAPAHEHPFAAALLEGGFRAGYKGLELDRFAARERGAEPRRPRA